MAWSVPFTAVTGTVIQASDWNTSGRDNLNYLKSSAIVLNAASSTTPNGSATVFNIGSGVASTSVAVYLNGLRRRATTDYSFTPGGSTVTFTFAPATGDDVRMDYVAA